MRRFHRETASPMLVAEGYIAARAKSGFTVCRIEKLDAPSVGSGRAAGTARKALGSQISARAVWTLPCFRSRHGRASSADSHRPSGASEPWLPPGDASCARPLPNICMLTGAWWCAPEQIVVGAGIEYLGGPCWPGCSAPAPLRWKIRAIPRTAQVLRKQRLCFTVFVPVDGDGMTLDALQAGGAQFGVCQCPATRSPTGATMSHYPAHGTLLRWAGGGTGTLCGGG